MNDIINKICKELPKNYEIVLEMENGSALVKYYNDNVDANYIDAPENSIEEQLEIALAKCKEDMTDME